MKIAASKRSEKIQEYQDLILSGRREIRSIHDGGADGLTVCNRLASLMDGVIREIYLDFLEKTGEDPDHPELKACVVALGGYGRNEMNPHSDIDLLFLHPDRPDSWFPEMVHHVITTLWDLGLQVGHSTRTIHHCVGMALNDETARTALLDARLLAGGKTLFDVFVNRFRRKVIERSAGFYIREKMASMASRHEKYLGTYLLTEPNIKESPGGLRDYQCALWACQIRFELKSLDSLVRRGILEQREADMLKISFPNLLRIRNGLHYLTDRKTDLIHHGIQRALSVHLGYPDSEEGEGVIEMMKQYFLDAGRIYKISRRVIERCHRYSFSVTRLLSRVRHKKTPDGFVVGDREVYWSGKEGKNPIENRPDRFLQAFRIAAEHDLPLGYRMILWLREAIRNDGGVMAAQLNREENFLSIFRDPNCAKILRRMHEVGVLGDLVPEFQEVAHVTHIDRYHKFTVDEHTLRGIEILESLGRSEGKDLEEFFEVYLNDPQPEIVKMAILFHDLGKHVRGGHHDDESCVQLEKIFGRVGLKAYREELRTLVKEHGLMSYTASRLNTYDERTLQEFREKIGTAQTLKRLFVLTYADTSAVGPENWSDWKKRLLSLLYNRTLSYFEQGRRLFLEEDEAVAEVKEQAAALLGSEVDPEQVRYYFSQMPSDYFLLRTPEHVADDIRFHSRYDGGDQVQVGRVGEVGGLEKVMICARDQLGLFSKIAGTFTSKNIDIVRAKLHTLSNGTVVDFFTVSGPNRAPLKDPSILSRFQKDLQSVLSGQSDVEELIRKRQKTINPFDPAKREIPSRVSVFNNASETHTVVEVSFEDRMGALYLITNALYRASVDIFSAKIATEGRRGINVFYVSDQEGKKITSKEVLERIRQDVIEALDREF